MSIINNNIFVSKFDGENEKLFRKNVRHLIFKKFNGFTIEEQFEASAERISKMNVRDEDIWVCSYPKTGTTWTLEMVWCIANDFDITTAEKPLSSRTIFLDFYAFAPHDTIYETEFYKLFSETSTKSSGARRIIKTHLPYDFLPEMLKNKSTKAKIIYVTRNPRDACISFFHHHKLMGLFVGSLEEFCDMFMKGILMYGPFWKNVLSYWRRRQNENLLFLKYEDMKNDLPSVIKKTANFLGITSTPSNECMNQLCEHLSFNSMKTNLFIDDQHTEMTIKANNPEGKGSFVRKGETDQWKKNFTMELIQRFANWEKENLSHEDFTDFGYFTTCKRSEVS